MQLRELDGDRAEGLLQLLAVAGVEELGRVGRALLQRIDRGLLTPEFEADGKTVIPAAFMLSHSLRAWIADVPFAAVQLPRGLEFEYLSGSPLQNWLLYSPSVMSTAILRSSGWPLAEMAVRSP